MKKFMFALFAVGLIALAIIPTACKKVETPSSYSSHTLRGITFSSPSDWSDKTSEFEKEMGTDYEDYGSVALWDSPTDAAGLMVMVLDIDDMETSNMSTDDEREEAAAGLTEIITTLMDDPTIVSNGKKTVDGEWAWETEFSGTLDGESGKGYLLTVFNDRSMVVVVYAGESKDWDKLGGVYNTVKDSIKF